MCDACVYLLTCILYKLKWKRKLYCIGEGREWILNKRVLKKGIIGEGGRLEFKQNLI